MTFRKFLVSVVSLFAGALSAQTGTRAAIRPTAPTAVERTASSRDGRLAYIIEFAAPPASRAAAPLAAEGRQHLLLSEHRAEVEASAREIARQQEEFASEWSARVPALSFGLRYSTVFNGIAVLAPPDAVPALRADPRVKALHAVRKHTLHLDASNPLMNAPAFWSTLGGDTSAGQGIKIGILDTGTDFSNPLFSDPSLSMPSGFPKENDGNSFANSKVIVAKYFQSIIDAADPTLNPGHKTAQDLSGHGSHTSGCAAGAKSNLSGNGRRTVTLEGVAPKAYLGDYRVFAPNAYDDNIIAAIDAAVADGMDVLNMSFGVNNPDGTEPFIFGAAAENEAIQNSIAAGVVITVSAGNSGPTPDSISSTANVPDVIGVGASSNSHDGISSASLARVTMTSGNSPPPANLTNITAGQGAGSMPFPTSPVSGPVADYDNLDGAGDSLGCTALTGTPLTGDLVLIQRGSCTFTQKVTNAANAGAIGVIIYNSVAGGDAIIIPSTDCTSSPTPGCRELPTVFIGRTDGLNLKTYLDANAGSPPAAHGNFAALPPGSQPLVFTGLPTHSLAGFSSVGPTIDLQIKPDLTTVGEGSYAPVQDDNALGEGRFPPPDPIVDEPLYDPSGFTFSQGTSFAAPRAAGSAALLLQKHPSWTPAEIKAALMETAARPTSTTDPNAVGNLSVMERGSGDIDLDAASRVNAIVLPANHSFGRVVSNALPYPGDLSFTFTLENKSASAVTYQISAADGGSVSSPGVAPAVNPSSLTVPAGGSGHFVLTLTLTNALAVGSHDAEGAIAVSDGGATIPGSLYIPYWARVAFQNGSAPLLQSMTASFDATTRTQLNIDFVGHDNDADINGFTLNVLDSTDSVIGFLSDTFQDCCGVDFHGQTDISVELQYSNFPTDFPDGASLTMQLFDNNGNVSGTLYSRFLTPPTLAIPSGAASQRAIALVAHAQGTRFFQSDVRIFNPASAHILPIDAYFVAQGQSGASALHTSHSINPRQSFALDDICLNDFAQTSAVGSLILLSDGHPFIATSRAYDNSAAGTFGTFAPGEAPSQTLGPSGGTASANGLVTASGFHTNIGATEVTGTAANVRFDGFDAAGNSVGSFTESVPAYSNVQHTPVSEGHFTSSPARVSFTVVSGGSVIPYATVVDDGSGDGFLSVAGVPPESPNDVFITEVAHVAGQNNTFFTSDLSLTNLSSGPRTVTLSLLPNFLSGSPATPSAITLQPGQTMTLADVLANQFGLSGNSGAGLLVHPSSAAKLLVSARTSTPAQAGAGTYGFFVQGAPASAALSAGGRLVSIQVAHNDAYRTNFGFTEVAGQGVTARATFFDENGTQIGSRAYPLAAHQSFQTSARDLIGDAQFANAYVEFTVDSGSGAVLPFLAVIDAGTGDAIYVPGAPQQ
jgi:subtilisin family serine protease